MLADAPPRRSLRVSADDSASIALARFVTNSALVVARQRQNRARGENAAVAMGRGGKIKKLKNIFKGVKSVFHPYFYGVRWSLGYKLGGVVECAPLYKQSQYRVKYQCLGG